MSTTVPKKPSLEKLSGSYTLDEELRETYRIEKGVFATTAINWCVFEIVITDYINHNCIPLRDRNSVYQTFISTLTTLKEDKDKKVIGVKRLLNYINEVLKYYKNSTIKQKFLDLYDGLYSAWREEHVEEKAKQQGRITGATLAIEGALQYEQESKKRMKIIVGDLSGISSVPSDLKLNFSPILGPVNDPNKNHLFTNAELEAELDQEELEELARDQQDENARGEDQEEALKEFARDEDQEEVSEEISRDAYQEEDSEELARTEQENEYIWDYWQRLLKARENKRNFSVYSPWRNNIIRIGKGILPDGEIDPDIYDYTVELVTKPPSSTLMAPLKSTLEYIASCETPKEWDTYFRKNDNAGNYIFNLAQDLGSIMYSVYLGKPSIFKSEPIYRQVVIIPLVTAACRGLSDVYVTPGEADLDAMTIQMANVVLTKRECYKADNIVSFGDIEILITECSGAFMNDEKVKINFDNIKAMFGAIAMLKCIVDLYYYANIDTMEKLKVFFVQSKEDSVHVWFISPLRRNIYVMTRELRFQLKPNYSDRLENFINMMSFSAGLNECINETTVTISKLKKEHEQHIMEKFLNPSIPEKIKLSDPIDPTIYKLSENNHSAGLARQGPNSFLVFH